MNELYVVIDADRLARDKTSRKRSPYFFKRLLSNPSKLCLSLFESGDTSIGLTVITQ